MDKKGNDFPAANPLLQKTHPKCMFSAHNYHEVKIQINNVHLKLQATCNATNEKQ